MPVSENYNPQLARLKRKNAQEPAYRRAPKQEKETTERIGGRAIPASGSRFRKADTEKPDIVRIECKSTRHDSFRVTRNMMQIVQEAGMLEGQVPAIQVEFVDNDSNVLDCYYVMKRRDVEHLIGRVADAEGIAPADQRGVGRSKLNKRKLPKASRFG